MKLGVSDIIKSGNIVCNLSAYVIGSVFDIPLVFCQSKILDIFIAVYISNMVVHGV